MAASEAARGGGMQVAASAARGEGRKSRATPLLVPPAMGQSPLFHSPKTPGNVVPTAFSRNASSTSSNGAQAHEKWSGVERVSYLASLGIVSLPEEEGLLRFLEQAMARTPLPSPWAMRRDQHGQVFFTNKVTGVSSWNHPLEPSVRELAAVCRVCLTLPPKLRESCIAEVRGKWQAQAEAENRKWYAVQHGSGREYYCHAETGEAMWEHPAEVILPAHYLKIWSIQRLRDEACLTALRSPSGAAPGAAAAPPADAGAAGKQHEHTARPLQEAERLLLHARPPERATSPTVPPQPTPRGLLRICLYDRVLGSVEVDSSSTLADVRAEVLADEIDGVPPSYRFLFGSAPVSLRQEGRRRAQDCFPMLQIIPEDTSGIHLVGATGSSSAASSTDVGAVPPPVAPRVAAGEAPKPDKDSDTAVASTKAAEEAKEPDEATGLDEASRAQPSPSIYESMPRKSDADFPARCDATPATTSTANAELEAKLAQQMRKCEGRELSNASLGPEEFDLAEGDSDADVAEAQQ